MRSLCFLVFIQLQLRVDRSTTHTLPVPATFLLAVIRCRLGVGLSSTLTKAIALGLPGAFNYQRVEKYFLFSILYFLVARRRVLFFPFKIVEFKGPTCCTCISIT